MLPNDRSLRLLELDLRFGDDRGVSGVDLVEWAYLLNLEDLVVLLI